MKRIPRPVYLNEIISYRDTTQLAASVAGDHYPKTILSMDTFTFERNAETLGRMLVAQCADYTHYVALYHRENTLLKQPPIWYVARRRNSP